ncbi:MAG TPA: hypothetical protein VNN25_02100 [Thermoanaerobaculia bacterium]|nr:hypothetical protein [Thermoanaerobaculia bacterium]
MILRALILALAFISVYVPTASAHTLVWDLRAESADLTYTGGFVYDPHTGAITSWTVEVILKTDGTPLVVFTPTNSHVTESPAPGEVGNIKFEFSSDDGGFVFTRTLTLTPAKPLLDAGNVVIPVLGTFQCGGDAVCQTITSGHIDNIADPAAVSALSPLAIVMLGASLVFIVLRASHACG